MNFALLNPQSRSLWPNSRIGKCQAPNVSTDQVITLQVLPSRLVRPMLMNIQTVRWMLDNRSSNKLSLSLQLISWAKNTALQQFTMTQPFIYICSIKASLAQYVERLTGRMTLTWYRILMKSNFFCMLHF